MRFIGEKVLRTYLETDIHIILSKTIEQNGRWTFSCCLYSHKSIAETFSVLGFCEINLIELNVEEFSTLKKDPSEPFCIIN